MITYDTYPIIEVN